MISLLNISTKENGEAMNRDRKMNNPSWCCDQIEELIKKYEKRGYYSFSISEQRICEDIVKDLEEILYGD